jgi:hypothetical protein
VRHRPALAAAAAAAACVAVAGCGGVDAALSRQWATVTFRPDTSAAAVAAVRAGCARVPGARPAALSQLPGTGDAPGLLRYDVSGASVADLARLQACLLRYRTAVLGVSLRDTANHG